MRGSQKKRNIDLWEGEMWKDKSVMCACAQAVCMESNPTNYSLLYSRTSPKSIAFCQAPQR